MLSQLTNTFFPLCSLVLSIFLAILFYSKKNFYNIETKIYSILVILGMLESFLYVFICLIGDFIFSESTYMFFYILIKILSVIYIAWMTFMTYYIYAICKGNELRNKKVKNSMIIFDILISIIIFICPMNMMLDRTKYISNTTGLAMDILYIVCSLYFAVMIFIILKNIKNNELKGKFIPFYVLILFFTISFIIRIYDPYFNITSNIFSFVLLIMYHTIENPDIKMITELNLAREQADKANNAKSEFLSSMSHEIRTPLNAIVGFSEALQDEDLSDSAREEVKDIISASQSLLDIVNGILDISKIEANKIEIVNVEYDFNKVLKDLVALTKARMGDKPLDFRTNFDPTIPSVLYGDQTRVKQIILNLLTNAIKYTKEGYVEFKVSCVIKDDICRLIISVEDSGIGIKQENVDKLFSKFERFDLEKNITIEGTGLGMAITKKLLDLMGGKIVVQSIYGEGSRFTVAIDQRIIAIDPIKAEEEKNENTQIDVSGKKVLIVDDNALNIKVATRLLKTYNLEIDSVQSGKECIDKMVIGEKFDLILMDDMMPGKSGVETYKELREIENFNTPTIILTANAISGMKEKYLDEYKFDDYLSKPIDRQELDRVIRKFLVK